MSAIARYLSGKTLFMTGTTGFLAKGVLEKILRHAPDVRRVYLLIRDKRLKDGTTLTAEERVYREIFASPAFNRLRGVHGGRMEAILGEKTQGVSGDLTLDHMGIDPDMYQRMTEEVDIVVNIAATVTFDEEIDYALQLNTLGAKRVVDFAKACRDAILVHVSTAYVNGQRTGRIPEAPPEADRSMAQEIGLSHKPFDLEQEVRDIQAAARQIHDDARSPAQTEAFRRAALRQNPKPTQRWLDAQMETFRKRWLQQRLIEEGIRRGKAWGWHDSYTLTKAMGEQMIVKTRGDLPVSIIRPSIVESSLVDPEPGWIEGLKVADPLIDAISRGRLPDFPADPEVTLDIVPVDIVANVTLAAILRTSQNRGIDVYQVTTGDQNPIKFREMFDLVYDYFVQNPRRNKAGQPIPVQRWTFPSLEQFRRRQLKYLYPLGAAHWLCDRLAWIPAVYRWRQKINVLKSAIDRMMYYAEIYSPYTMLDCTFETTRTMRLHRSMDAEDQAVFNCDVSRIRWKDYIQQIHIPGLQRHVLKTEAPEREDAEAEVAARSGFEQEAEEALPHLDTISDIIEKSAERYPDRVALQMKRDGAWTRYTYRDVYTLAGRIGWYWRQRGLHPGDRVLLYAENSPAWGIAYFAAMAAGATVVPIDRHAPKAAVRSTAAFVEARAILCSARCFEHLTTTPDDAIPVWNIDNYGRPFEDPPPDPPLLSVDENPPAWATIAPETVASIIFTKEKAGDGPLGVMLSHRNVVSNLLALAEVLRPYRTDTFLSVLPLTHAFEFTCGFLMPFYTGATITYAGTVKPRSLIALMKETGATGMLAVPRIFRALHHYLQQGDTREVVERLRLLVSGVDALDAELYEAYRRLGVTIYEGYGLTETAPILTVNPMGHSKPRSVGPALPGVDLRIDHPDEHGHGEIVMRGPNMMAGYYRNPAATAAFIRDGWLYTGDTGRMDEDGYLYLVG